MEEDRLVGELDTHDVICRQLANRGNFDVISIDYGLAPGNFQLQSKTL